MFGATSFLPLFLQIVTGASATNSGLLIVPMMAGLTISSIITGRRITLSGRYRIYPIIGTALCTVGVACCRRWAPTRPGCTRRSRWRSSVPGSA